MSNTDSTPYGYCQCGCGQAAPVASQTDRKYGWIKGEPMRYVRGHAGRKSGTDYAIEDRGYDTPCWVWQRGTGSNGYGKVSCNVTGERWAHRVNYVRANGPIPAGLELDHLCRVTLCVNPDHLEPVSHATNVQRGKNTKLTWADVNAIRASSLTNVALAARYGIHPDYVGKIRKGKYWKTTP